MPLQPLAHWPANSRRALAGVFTDIDDTLSTDGAVPADVLHAMAALRAAGLHVIAITGRPVGWCLPFAPVWPVNAIVAENGAVALIGPGQPPRRLYLQDAATRATNHARLQAVAAQVLREVPGAALAQDSAGRETDIAIDHSEHSHLPPERIEQVAQLMRAQGLRATVSSIHINGWIGEHDKWQGACWIARELLGITDLFAQRQRWAYIGDSTNDQVMFQHFPHSIGVANIRRFAPQLQHLPAYITPSERGAGFIEMAQAILQAKAAGDAGSA